MRAPFRSPTKTPAVARAVAASAQASELVVFIVRRETACTECTDTIGKGEFLRVDRDAPLCLNCADLGHLTFLPAGDATVTRRATKHSPLRAVVVRWSNSRKRYERQGILVTLEAIDQAEADCVRDEEGRARQRESAAARREVADLAYTQTVAATIAEQFPGCPAGEAQQIAAWTCQKHSGRVGRSAAAKQLDPDALLLAVQAHVRHNHTPYDALLMRLGDRNAARASVRAAIDAVLRRWRARG